MEVSIQENDSNIRTSVDEKPGRSTLNTKTPSRRLKRSNYYKRDSELVTIEDFLKKPKLKEERLEDRYDILGRCVALKMRDISDNTQKLLAEKIINETLFLAEMGQLTTSHSISKVNSLPT